MSRTAPRPGFASRKWSGLPRFTFVGARMRSFLSPKDTGSLSVYHIALARGGEILPAYHKKAIELIWVVRGGGVARLGRRAVRLRRGDSMIIRPPTPHGFTAGRAGMTFLAVLSPRVDSKTDYFSCSGHRHAPPRAPGGGPARGGVR